MPRRFSTYPTETDLLNEMVRDAVRESGMSNRRIARETGIERSTISQWVNWTPSELSDPDPPTHYRYASPGRLGMIAAAVGYRITVHLERRDKP